MEMTLADDASAFREAIKSAISGLLVQICLKKKQQSQISLSHSQNNPFSRQNASKNWHAIRNGEIRQDQFGLTRPGAPLTR